MTPQPNLLWIMTDQHRADCLGCMGHPAIQTPHLDALAEEGVLFENAFCQSPVCMASRGVLFTGRYPEAIRIRGMGVLPPSEITIGEMLKRHGYRTAAFGKVHLTPEQHTRAQLNSDIPILDWRRFAVDAHLSPIPDAPCKRDYGFDLHMGCDDANQGHFRRWLKQHAPDLAELKPQRPVESAPGDLFVSPYPSRHHQSTFIAESCAEFLRHQKTGEPWFAFCSFVAPHHPFEAPEDQIARYDLDTTPLPRYKGGVDPAFIPPPMADAVDEIHQFSEAVQRRIVLHYLASISLIDDNTGRLVAALKETGQLENTILLFVSDHGEFLGNHGLLRKPSLHYDEVMQVPLILRLPECTCPGRRVSGLVELTDVCPTLLGLLDLPTHPGVQGIDWSDALRSGDDIGREDIYSDMFDLDPMVFARGTGPYGAVRTLRTRDWKLNVYPTAGQKYGQLFDLQNDPAEAHNLYGDPEHRDRREEMLWRLLQRIHRNADPLPLRLTQW